jgi:hypothetical protein
MDASHFNAPHVRLFAQQLDLLGLFDTVGICRAFDLVGPTLEVFRVRQDNDCPMLGPSELRVTELRNEDIITLGHGVTVAGAIRIQNLSSCGNDPHLIEDEWCWWDCVDRGEMKSF